MSFYVMMDNSPSIAIFNSDKQANQFYDTLKRMGYKNIRVIETEG